MSKKILVIDDEKMIVESIEAVLEGMGYEVDTCLSASEGEHHAVEKEYDLIITDLKMPEKSGAEVTKAILSVKPDAKILIITGHPGDPLAKKAIDFGAKGLVKKPFEIAKILDFLRD